MTPWIGTIATPSLTVTEYVVSRGGDCCIWIACGIHIWIACGVHIDCNNWRMDCSWIIQGLARFGLARSA
jgi:hypothetical protein